MSGLSMEYSGSVYGLNLPFFSLGVSAPRVASLLELCRRRFPMIPALRQTVPAISSSVIAREKRRRGIRTRNSPTSHAPSTRLHCASVSHVTAAAAAAPEDCGGALLRLRSVTIATAPPPSRSPRWESSWCSLTSWIPTITLTAAWRCSTASISCPLPLIQKQYFC